MEGAKEGVMEGAKEGGEDGEEGKKQFNLPSRLRQYWISVSCKRRLVSLCAFLRQVQTTKP